MTSILEKLHNWEKSVGADIKHIPAMLKEDVQEAIHHIDGSQSVIEELKAQIAAQFALLEELKAENEKLKATAGAVSAGQSFADIKTAATGQQAVGEQK